jgi:CelD/BcsL family acetyltransferase involved in cellulose biosynthesis
MKTELQTTIVDSFEELDGWADQWDELAQQMPQKLAVLSHAWIRSFLQHRMGTSERWICVIAQRDGELVGVLPLVVQNRQAGPIPIVVLSTPFDWHTISSDCTVRLGHEQTVIPALIREGLRHVPQAVWLEMRRLPVDSPTLQIDFTDTGLPLEQQEDGPGAIYPTVGDFDTYFEGLSGSFRRKLRRAVRGLTQESGNEPRLEVVTENPQERFEALLDLEASGWKGDRGSAIKCSDSLAAFYRDLVNNLARRGWLELYLLTCGSSLLAGSLGVRIADAVTLAKTSYDESFRKHSPGNVARLEIIRRAFHDDDISYLDGLSLASYHGNWNVGARSYKHLWVFRPGLKGNLLGRIPHRLRNWARTQNWLRRLLRKAEK